jgi:hypothetical protein
MPRSKLLFTVRYVVPAALILVGFVVLLVPNGSQADGFALFVGAGISVALLNVLYRIGVGGEAERDREEQARAYFDEHGEWPPDEEPRDRDWRLPVNVVMPDDERERG